MNLDNYGLLSQYIKRHFNSLLPFVTLKKSYNITRCLLDMYKKNTINSGHPFVYRIDPCSLCNLSCISCDTPHFKTDISRIMKFDTFKSIVDSIQQYALRLSLYDHGEPLLNNNIYDMIGYATDLHLSTLISTNFNLFTDKHIDNLFNSGLTVLEPCLDGFSQETYTHYRVNGNVDKVKSNIEVVMREKHRKKSKYPIVDVQVIKFNHIEHELSKIHSFLTNLKVDAITYRKEHLGFDSTNLSPIANRYKNNKTCYWLYIGMTVRPDGGVYPCCGRSMDRLTYGNLKIEPLSAIWNNKYYRFSRELFTPGDKILISKEFSQIPCLTCDMFPKVRQFSYK